MQQKQQSDKIRKKVIIINQKSDAINENINKMNQIEDNQQFINEKQQFEESQEKKDSTYQNYLQEMKEIYQLNLSKLKDLQGQIQQLQVRTDQVEKLIVDLESTHKKKKKRRTAAEIEKNFKCPYENCEKWYGSEVSLNLHIKVKHNGGNKNEIDKIQEELDIKELQQQEVQEKINQPH